MKEKREFKNIHEKQKVIGVIEDDDFITFIFDKEYMSEK